EVDFLMGLLRHYMRRELETLAKEGARLRGIGHRDGLSRDIALMIRGADARTRANARINVTIALNYGGRADIVRAAQRLAERAAAGGLGPASITQEGVAPGAAHP